jgi:hypothetical protein
MYHSNLISDTNTGYKTSTTMAVTLPYILFDFVYYSIDFTAGYFRLICDISALLSSNRPTAPFLNWLCTTY